MENIIENKSFPFSIMMSPERRILGDIQNKFASDTLSPTTNLKLLTEVASDFETRWAHSRSPNRKENERWKKTSSKYNYERKLKSLTLLCEKFLQIFPLNVTPNENIVISLDSVAARLETERRRLYDIINMLECLQMARKVAKNSYRWFGCQKLHVTLAHLKVLATKLGLQQQARTNETLQHRGKSGRNEENLQKHSAKVQYIQARNNTRAVDDCNGCNELHSPIKTVSVDVSTAVRNHQADVPVVQFIITDEDEEGDDSITTLNVDILKKRFEPVVVPNNAAETVSAEMPDFLDSEFSKMLPKIKSLGMLCQAFLMIFLVADEAYPITLDNVSRILGLPVSCEGDADIASCAADTSLKDSVISYKTKLRRLYDIANVLSSLHIICKIKRCDLQGKKPLFKYTGPVVEIREVWQSARHSLIGNELLETPGNETMLELKLQPGNHAQWIVSTIAAENTMQYKKKSHTHNSETTPKLLRTRSNDVLCRKKKNLDTRLKNTTSSLDGILNIAEMELQRLQSMEESLHSESPEKRKRDSRDEQPTAARRRLFSRHHSEPCLNIRHSVTGHWLQEMQQKPVELLCEQKITDASPNRNQTGNSVQQQILVTAPITDKMNSAQTTDSTETISKPVKQSIDQSDKTVTRTESGQKLKIVRRFEKLSFARVLPRSVFVKTYHCKPVRIVSLSSSSTALSKSAEAIPACETNSSPAAVHQDGAKQSGTDVSNFSCITTLKDVDYSKLPKLKLVKTGNIMKLVPLGSINGKHQ